MTMNYVQQHKEDFDKTIEHLKHDLQSLRTGRATPMLVEDIMVEAYGGKQQLKAVASISVLDAKTLAIEPWDKSLISAVDAALRQSPLGINPVNDGKLIRLPLPTLTQERRQELIKVLHQKLEAARISVRQNREEVKRLIDKAEKDGVMPEDEKFKQQDFLEKMVKEFNEPIKTIGEEKEKEINTV